MIIAVIGATSTSGRYVIDRLAATSHDVIAVGRDPSKLARIPAPATTVVADLERPRALERALADADRVASLAHARFTSHVLAALPPGCDRVVLTGSIRRDTALVDPEADEVRSAEALFLRSGVPGLMLHPSMIYDGITDRNVGRLLGALRRWPRWLPVVVPLPGRGRHTVQPVFVDDVAAAVVGALLRPEAPGPPVAVVGPEPITYAAMVQTCAAAVGRRALVVPAPPRWLLARLAGRGRPPAGVAELLRATEDKRYDPAPMVARLGVAPRPFAEGLRHAGVAPAP